MTKSRFFTHLSRKLLQYAIFIHQTASQVIHDEEAEKILAKIEEILELHYRSGDVKLFGNLSQNQAIDYYDRFGPSSIKNLAKRVRNGLSRTTGVLACLDSYSKPAVSRLGAEIEW